MLVEDANNIYTMLVLSNHWGPSGKVDSSNGPEGLLSRAEENTLVP